jgi:glycosyltransferase involved in cell wall biosynthesis
VNLLKLSIIVPSYQEDETIRTVISKIEEQCFPFDYEIIIVDDGSTVPAKNYILDFIACGKVRYYRLPKNQGKGCAVNIGIRKASGDYIIIQDADMEYHPEDIRHLVDELLKSGASAVYGCRFSGHVIRARISHVLGNRLINFVNNKLFGTHLADLETGYKIMRTADIRSLGIQAREFDFEVEVTAKMQIAGFKIVEVPIRYAYRKKGNAKVSFIEGVEAVMSLFVYRSFSRSTLAQWMLDIFKGHGKPILRRVRTRLFGKSRF